MACDEFSVKCGTFYFYFHEIKNFFLTDFETKKTNA